MLKPVKSHKQVTNLISSCNGSGKTFAEFIADLFKDEFIEIYLGDSYEDVSTEQVTTSYPAVFCGKVIGAYKECLVLDTCYLDIKSQTYKLGNLVFINERSIRALNQVNNDGTLQDMFIRSTEAKKIAATFNE